MVNLQSPPQDPTTRGNVAYINKKSLLLIFNHENFEEELRKGERKGSDKDVELLRSSFEYISFIIRLYNDYTYDQIMNTLKTEDFSQYDSIVVVVLSYGEAGFLYAKDRRYRDVELINILKGIQIEKPKIIMLQASREVVDDSRMVIFDDLVEDMVVIFSTSYDGSSYRNIYSGSIFVKALSKHILALRSKENFEEVINRAEKMVRDSTHDSGYVQNPEIITKLNKTYYVQPRIITFANDSKHL